MATGKGPANSRDALRALPGREFRPGPSAHERPLRALSPAECLDLLERGAATKARKPITALQLLARRGLDPLTS